MIEVEIVELLTTISMFADWFTMNNTRIVRNFLWLLKWRRKIHEHNTDEIVMKNTLVLGVDIMLCLLMAGIYHNSTRCPVLITIILHLKWFFFVFAYSFSYWNFIDSQRRYLSNDVNVFRQIFVFDRQTAVPFSVHHSEYWLLTFECQQNWFN